MARFVAWSGLDIALARRAQQAPPGGLKARSVKRTESLDKQLETGPYQTHGHHWPNRFGIRCGCFEIAELELFRVRQAD